MIKYVQTTRACAVARAPICVPPCGWYHEPRPKQSDWQESWVWMARQGARV